MLARREMPFLKRKDNEGWWKPAGEDEEPDILLRQVGPNSFQLLDPFAYQVPGWDKKPYEIPKHDPKKPPKPPTGEDNSTDLTSVPYVFWWFIASHGRQTRPALVHDYLVDAPAVITRRDADTVFRLALEESRIPWLRRWLMWTAVSLATNAKSWWGRLYVGFFVLFLAAFAFSLLYWAFADRRWWPLGWLPFVPGWGERWPFGSSDWWPFAEHGWLPWGGSAWLPAAVVAVAGLWGARRWLLALLGLILIGPPTVLVLAAIGVVWLVDLVASPFVWIFSGAAFRGGGIDLPSLPRPYRKDSRPF
jgi:hypothetical protein